MGNTHRSSIVFIGPGGEADVRISAGARIGRYMHVFEGALWVTRTCDKVNDCVVSLATDDDMKRTEAWHCVPLMGRWF